MALEDEPTGYDWRAARAFWTALTLDRDDQRPWEELPDHRRWRIMRATQAAIAEYESRRQSPTVIAFRSNERTG